MMHEMKTCVENLLSSDCKVRKNAEVQLENMKVRNDFSLMLLNIVVGDLKLALRQTAAVILKQYISTHWTSNADVFYSPEISEEVKVLLRKELPRGLMDHESRIRSAVAFCISYIAQWDWPEVWPEIFPLLMTALDGHDRAFIHGAMCVFGEMSRDMTDAQLPHVVPLLMPALLRVASTCSTNDNGLELNIRSRAISIFTSLLHLIHMVSDVVEDVTDMLLAPILPQWLKLLLQVLVGSEGDRGEGSLKANSLLALAFLVVHFPNHVAPYIDDLISTVYHMLVSNLSGYVSEVVFSRSYEYDDIDAYCDNDMWMDTDHNALRGLEGITYGIFDVISAIVAKKQFRVKLSSNLNDIVFCIIAYVQVSDGMLDSWNADTDQFMEDEDEDSFTHNVRVVGDTLLNELSKRMCEPMIAALNDALGRHIPTAMEMRSSGNESWWRLYEACLLSIGQAGPVLVARVKRDGRNYCDFDLEGLLNNLLEICNQCNEAPLLLGRALWLASQFGAILPGEIAGQFVGLSVRGLNSDMPLSVRISALKAVQNFCNSVPQEVVIPHLAGIMKRTVALGNSDKEGVLLLALDVLEAAARLDAVTTAAQKEILTPLALAAWFKLGHDTFIFDQVLALLKAILAVPACYEDMERRVIPTLSSVLLGPHIKVGHLQGSAVQVLAALVLAAPSSSSNNQFSTALIAKAFPALMTLLLNSEDTDVLQEGCDCLQIYVARAPNDLVTWSDGSEHNGISLIVQLVAKLLGSDYVESAGVYVGRVIISLLSKVPDALSHVFEDMLRVILERLHNSRRIVLTQWLVMVFAQLILTLPEPSLAYLAKPVTFTVESGFNSITGMHVLLPAWLENQSEFHGAHAIKFTCAALASLFVASPPLLHSVVVRGERIHDASNTIRTRSKRIPERWTNVTAFEKIFYLLATEYSNDDKSAGCEWEDVDEDDDDDDNDNGNDEDDLANEIYLSEVLENGGDAENDRDMQLMDDPLQGQSLNDFLANFMRKFSEHDPSSFGALVTRIGSAEQEALKKLLMS